MNDTDVDFSRIMRFGFADATKGLTLTPKIHDAEAFCDPRNVDEEAIEFL